jgi:hypothetical protein
MFEQLSSGILKAEPAMAYLPRGVAQPMEMVKSLNALTSLMPPAVVNWRYTIDNDWSGDPALFFWVTLSDQASRPENLPQITKYITGIITNHIDPMGEWGLIPYINFRSQSEQARLKEEVFG